MLPRDVVEEVRRELEKGRAVVILCCLGGDRERVLRVRGERVRVIEYHRLH